MHENKTLVLTKYSGTSVNIKHSTERSGQVALWVVVPIHLSPEHRIQRVISVLAPPRLTRKSAERRYAVPPIHLDPVPRVVVVISIGVRRPEHPQ